MPNPIKYSTSAQTLALKKGNFWIGTGDVGKGPTSTTDYYNGITPPSGGYTIYLNKASGGPSIYTAANDSQLVSLTNTISYITTNYISNGGNFANGTVSPFTSDYSGAGGVARVVSIANDRPYAGSTSTNALEFNYNGGRAMDTTGLLTVGQTYTFSFWAKITSGSSFSIGWNNQNGQGETNSWSSGGFSLTTSWQRYSQVFTYNAARTTFFFSTRNQTVGTLAVFTEFQLSLGSAPCGPGLTTATESINWFLTQTDKMVFNADYPAVVTNGLVLNLDAGFTPSITSLPTNIVGGSYGSYTPVWYDVSSGGNNGSLINGPTFSSANGGSIVFDGVDDYVNIPDNSVLDFTGSVNLTSEVWIKFNLYKDISFVNAKGDGSGLTNNYNYFFIGTNTAFYFRFSNGTTSQSSPIIGSSTLPTGSWGHVVGVLDTSAIRIYLNGTEIGTATARTINPAANNSPFYISTPSYSLNGSVGASRIYNRALSAAEILQNYNATKSRFGL
jgi:hypothetical protein